MAEQITMTADALDDYILMPRRLTAANGAKALLSGEHSESIEQACAECDPDDPDEECEMCGGDGTYTQHVPISWSCIKLIYAQAVEGLSKEFPTLPCDAMLPPATIIRRGCSFNALLNALSLREGKPEELCTIQRALPAATEQLLADQFMRARVADLLHLLQYASIKTPSSGDAEQAQQAMSDLARMIAEPPVTDSAELLEVLELVTDCLAAAITGGQMSAAKAGSALVRASELLIKAKEAPHA